MTSVKPGRKDSCAIGSMRQLKVVEAQGGSPLSLWPVLLVSKLYLNLLRESPRELKHGGTMLSTFLMPRLT